jgi:segregation and condensation protein B
LEQDAESIANAIEALIFAGDRPATTARLRKVFPELTGVELGRIVASINAALLEQGRPYEIVEVNGGYQFRTRPEYGAVIRAARPERRVRLSRAALETLAVVAYRQPLTRAELEELRCVDCGAVLRTLLERDLVRIVGRRDVPGRPSLYGSTSNFLETFSLRSLRDLPDLREAHAMVEEDGTIVDLGAAARAGGAELSLTSSEDEAPGAAEDARVQPDPQNDPAA